MVFDGFTLKDLLGTWNATIGLNWSMDRFRKAGERIFDLNKLLNLHYGKMNADDLVFPQGLMEPKPDGVCAGIIPEGYEKAIDDYYKVRGWDNKGTLQRKLAELGFDNLLRKRATA
jgi:aldehyde:ferredoxin oxidoreductase